MNKPTPTSNDQLLNSLLGEMAGGQPEKDGFDILSYVQVVLKHKWGILSLALLVALLSTIYVSTLVPLYQAETSLLFDPPSANNYGTVRDQTAMDVYSSYSRNFRLFKAQQEIMRSRKFAADMVDRYELWSHPYFVAQADASAVEPAWKTKVRKWLPTWALDLKQWVPEWLLELTRPEFLRPPQLSDEQLKARYRDAAMAAVQEGLTIHADEEIMLIKLGFVSRDPEFAADMANKLADYYIRHDLESRMEAFAEATSWLTERTAELRENVILSDQQLQQFRERENLVSLEGGSILGREAEDVFQRLTEARQKTLSLSLAQDRLNSSSNSLSRLAGSPELIKYPSVTEALGAVLDAEKNMDQLARVYGPKHPKMVEARSGYDRLKEKLESEQALVKLGVSADLAAARAEVERLSAKFDQLKEQVQETDKKKFQLQALERNQQTDQELYDLFVTRFKELNIGSDVSSPNAQIIDDAQVPAAPYWPDKPRLVMIYTLVALFFGVALAFLREYLDKTIKSPEEVEEKLGVPLLGGLAQLDIDRDSESAAERMFIDKNTSLFAESIRTIRTGIMLSGLDEPHKILAITSTVPGEGKTTVSMNIACALGQLGKVLLIDADMRRAALGPHFGFARNTPGLADVAAGIKQLDECIHHFDEGNIDLLPAGTIPPNPQELLSSTRFEEILREVSGRYDRIVIDTAPTHMVSDPMLVARWASALIYVVRAETTYYQLAREHLRALEKVGKPILGIVLNGVSEHRTSHRHYRRYSKKGYGYGGYGNYGAHPYGGYTDADDTQAPGKQEARGAKGRWPWSGSNATTAGGED
ncbi:MAG: formate--tetrahydrofolate ligase [Halioglobus sp.]|nr:formate--tetrahydrofolate ligase [Halioglobus sp.]